MKDSEIQSVRFKSSFLTQNTILVIFPTFWFLIWSNLTTVNQFWPFVTAFNRDDYLQKYWRDLGDGFKKACKSFRKNHKM